MHFSGLALEHVASAQLSEDTSVAQSMAISTSLSDALLHKYCFSFTQPLETRPFNSVDCIRMPKKNKTS